jgi:SAM-dependent methyltransferase
MYQYTNHLLPPMNVPGVHGRVHRNDLMFHGRDQMAINVYREVGNSAASFLAAAVEGTCRQAEDVASCLDFGCGHGRVLRVLVQAFPRARITACDLDPEAVRFCASEFGAIPLRSDQDIHKVGLERYDLIWMGSVLTHVDERAGREIVRTLAAHLNPSGVLAFSTHGAYAREHIGDFGKAAGAAQRQIEASLDTNGFAYLPYRHYASDGYGLAWHTESYVRSLMSASDAPNLTVVSYEPGGWMGTQDLWAVTASG